MTLMERAGREITPEIRHVAQEEGADAEKLRRLVAKGRVVIPKNKKRDTKPTGIGEGLRVKVNANLGSSQDHLDVKEEIEKVRIAEKYGAHTVMDLSTGGDIDSIREQILAFTKIPVGTVPIYQAGIRAAREDAIVNMSSDDIFNGIRKHAEDGVDFMTVHCGVTEEVVKLLKKVGRVTNIVSRGGAFLAAWILHNGEENPLYSEYDYLLEMAREYDFTISLGDGLRPGSIPDATDAPQIAELVKLGELVKRSRDAKVQTMVEGPGHVPLHEVRANVQLQKAVCDGAPFYVLGPLVTDIAPGYDHITGAIGGAAAAMAGADFLCYVTPAEHLSLPTLDDVKEGVIASRIAAHAGDLTKGIDEDLDLEMSKARRDLSWEKMFDLSIDSEKCRRYRKRRSPNVEDACSMCGDVCAIRLVKEYFSNDDA